MPDTDPRGFPPVTATTPRLDQDAPRVRDLSAAQWKSGLAAWLSAGRIVLLLSASGFNLSPDPADHQGEILVAEAPND